MKFSYRIAAEMIFLAHVAVFFLVLFGWSVPSLWYLSMALSVATLLSDLTLGYCIMSKWEFDLRRRSDPAIAYNYTWTSYYTYWITNGRMSDAFFGRASAVFLAGSLSTNIYFHYFFLS